jgi:hypothetical protein
VTITGIPLGYDWPGFTECKVFSNGKDVAAGKPATADSWQHRTDAAAAIDGNAATAWTIDDATVNHWLKVDLGRATTIAGCRILWEAPGYWYQYRIETSSDDQTWSTVVDQTANKKVESFPSHDFKADGVRYVRLTLTGVEQGCWPGVREFEIAGPK